MTQVEYLLCETSLLFCNDLFRLWLESASDDLKHDHGVQRRMISVDNIFRIFEIIIFCFVVAICDLVHAVEAT